MEWQTGMFCLFLIANVKFWRAYFAYAPVFKLRPTRVDLLRCDFHQSSQWTLAFVIKRHGQTKWFRCNLKCGLEASCVLISKIIGSRAPNLQFDTFLTFSGNYHFPALLPNIQSMWDCALTRETNNFLEKNEHSNVLQNAHGGHRDELFLLFHVDTLVLHGAADFKDEK